MPLMCWRPVLRPSPRWESSRRSSRPHRRLVSSVYPPIFLAAHHWEQGRQLAKAGPIHSLYSALQRSVWYAVGRPSVWLSVSMCFTRLDQSTRKLCYRKDDHAMRPIYRCPENFAQSLTTSTPPCLQNF